jgi:hypothetical protein
MNCLFELTTDANRLCQQVERGVALPPSTGVRTRPTWKLFADFAQTRVASCDCPQSPTNTYYYCREQRGAAAHRDHFPAQKYDVALPRNVQFRPVAEISLHPSPRAIFWAKSMNLDLRSKDELRKHVVCSKEFEATYRLLPHEFSHSTSTHVNVQHQSGAPEAFGCVQQSSSLKRIVARNRSNCASRGFWSECHECPRSVPDRCTDGANTSSERRPPTSKKSAAPRPAGPVKPRTSFRHILDLDAPLWANSRGFHEKTCTERKNRKCLAPAQRDPSRTTRDPPASGALRKTTSGSKKWGVRSSAGAQDALHQEK